MFTHVFGKAIAVNLRVQIERGKKSLKDFVTLNTSRTRINFLWKNRKHTHLMQLLD